jgi:hypothetical protein
MNDIQILTDELVKFRDERNWSQFHNTKDLALAISIEAAEIRKTSPRSPTSAIAESPLRFDLPPHLFILQPCVVLCQP